jgi:2-iminobutanoate/2-iminopropanoate deaminase
MKDLLYILLSGMTVYSCTNAVENKVAANKTAILTPKAPVPIGPYSQAIQKGNMLFVSGQIAINPATNAMDTANITQETRQVMENIQAILNQANMNFTQVVKTTIYLTDIKSFSQVNEVYATYIQELPAARETVEVRSLPKGAHIEISVIAVAD